jgi:hypothetical protein
MKKTISFIKYLRKDSPNLFWATLNFLAGILLCIIGVVIGNPFICAPQVVLVVVYLTLYFKCEKNRKQ